MWYRHFCYKKAFKGSKRGKFPFYRAAMDLKVVKLPLPPECLLFLNKRKTKTLISLSGLGEGTVWTQPQ